MKRTAICAIVKNEGRYIREWIAYHSAIGFDHFYIFDNDSTDDTRDALEAAARAGVCTVSTWKNQPGLRTQVHAYRAGFALAKTDGVEWLMCLDADELLNLQSYPNIGAFLDDYEDADAIGVNWRLFGDNGATKYEPGLMMERFRCGAMQDFGSNHLIKTIAKVSSMIEPHIHTHRLVDGALFVNVDRTPLKHFPAARQDHVTFNGAQINHYFGKTAEEWEVKRVRGKADLPPEHPDRIRSDGEFTQHNRNDELDESILVWRDATLNNIERLFPTDLDEAEQQALKWLCDDYQEHHVFDPTNHVMRDGEMVHKDSAVIRRSLAGPDEP